MAKGGDGGESPAEQREEEYVLRSGVRAGLKREFFFAMKAQSELSLSPLLGRTRSSKRTKNSEPSDFAASPSEPSDEDRVMAPMEKKKVITYKRRRHHAPLEKTADVAEDEPLTVGPAEPLEEADDVAEAEPLMVGHAEPLEETADVEEAGPLTAGPAELTDKPFEDGSDEVADRVYASGRRLTRSMVNRCDLESKISKEISICSKCKVSSVTSGNSEFGSLCDSCIETESTLIERSESPSIDYSPSKKASLVKKAKSFGQLTRKDLGLHKNIFHIELDGMLVEYCNTKKTKDGGTKRIKLLDGYVKYPGIFCYCCSTVISPSQFEAHAGYASRRKPYHHIYTSSGISLHTLSVEATKQSKISPKNHDDLCTICMDGGDFLLCGSCPRVYHLDCLGLSTLPKGKYYCRYCRTQKGCNIIGSIDQIVKQCVRIASSQDSFLGGCALCKEMDFSKAKFDDRTVLLCDQCEKEYHVGCLRDHNMADLKNLPKGEWFCSPACKTIRKTLKDVVLGGPTEIQNSDLDLIKKKRKEKGLNGTGEEELDLKWRLLSPKWTGDDEKKFFSKAVNIFHESFAPMVDAGTQQDIIASMVYGRTFGDLDYSGMYCAVLTEGSSVVSVGLLRVMGGEAAELPLVATTTESKGLGYFQALFASIERLLGKLEVKHFVLPAAHEAFSIWTSKFGFSPITSHELEKCLKGSRTSIFEGTSFLHKLVPSLS